MEVVEKKRTFLELNKDNTILNNLYNRLKRNEGNLILVHTNYNDVECWERPFERCDPPGRSDETNVLEAGLIIPPYIENTFETLGSQWISSPHSNYNSLDCFSLQVDKKTILNLSHYQRQWNSSEEKKILIPQNGIFAGLKELRELSELFGAQDGFLPPTADPFHKDNKSGTYLNHFALKIGEHEIKDYFNELKEKNKGRGGFEKYLSEVYENFLDNEDY